MNSQRPELPAAKPSRHVWHGRVLAGMPLALIGILVVTGVAFGATYIHSVILPAAAATPSAVTIGDEASGGEAPVGALFSPQPTVAATPRAATPVPTVAPTSAPPAGSVVDLGPLDALDNIDHALTFSWNPYTGGPFGGYVLVYEPTSSGKSPDYLAGSPNWASAPAAVTSIKVNYIPAGSYQVRLQVLTNIGGLDTLVAETTVIHVRLSAALFSPQPTVAATPRAATPVPTVAPTSAPPAGSVVDLGPLDALDNIDHTLTFSWNPYTGGPFGGYVLVYEPTSSGKSPDYLAGSPNWASAPAAVTSIKVNYIPAGSYQVRLQVLTNIGGLDTLVAETTVIHVRLSAALFSPSPAA